MTKTVILTSFTLSLLAVDIHAAPSETWTALQGVDVSINEKSIERQQNGNVRVWQREKLLPKVVTKLELDLKAIGHAVDFSDYEYSIKLWEYDCTRKRLGTVSGADYSIAGEVINSFELEKPSMTAAIPDSVGEFTLSVVCSNMRSKRRK